jgi:hypothetical protein
MTKYLIVVVSFFSLIFASAMTIETYNISKEIAGILISQSLFIPCVIGYIFMTYDLGIKVTNPRK